MNSYKTLIQFLPIVAVLLLFSCETVNYERPKDNWAFRSVLDGKPRMLNLALDSTLYVSYDLQLSKIYKVWNGGIKLDGAVYTTAHGVQPTSYGHSYYEDISNSNQWRLRKNGSDETPEINYLGYSFKKGQVVLEYELIAKSGDKIRIKETPEFKSENGKTGLSRKFELSSGISAYIPVLFFTTDNKEETDLKSDGGILNSSGTSANLELATKKNTLDIFYKSVAFKLETKIQPAMTVADRGQVFMKSNDCKLCHLKSDDLVGPSYEAIAKKYPYSIAEVKNLAEKIINGGSGVWGDYHDDTS